MFEIIVFSIHISKFIQPFVPDYIIYNFYLLRVILVINIFPQGTIIYFKKCRKDLWLQNKKILEPEAFPTLFKIFWLQFEVLTVFYK